MKILPSLLVVLVASCAVAQSKAEDQNYSKLFAGPQAYYYHLNISNGSTTGPTATPNPFTGCLPGVIGGYEYQKPNDLYAVLQISYALGNITRKDLGTGNNQRFIHETLLETRLGYDGELERCGIWNFIPYTGAGFRWNLQYRNPGTLSGLKFDYFKIYIPLGLLVHYTPNPYVKVGVDFEWMPDILSMVSLSSLSGSYWELKRMNNYLAQLPCTFNFAERYEIGIIPFWMHFEDGGSFAKTDAGIALDLVKQITNDWGGRVTFGVYF